MPAPRHVVLPIVAVLACTSVACSEETKDRLRELAASRTPSRSLSPPASLSVRPTQEPTGERTPVASPTQEASDLAQPSPVAAEEPATDGSAPWVVLVFVAILAGVAVGVYVVTKRRSAPDASDGR